MTETTTATAPTVTPRAARDPVVRKLSNSVVINSAEFGKLKPAGQTQALATAGQLPIVFVDSFSSLYNTADLARKLLTGEDVSMELEFNDIVLSEEEQNAIVSVRPVLDRIKSTLPPYDFARPLIERIIMKIEVGKQYHYIYPSKPTSLSSLPFSITRQLGPDLFEGKYGNNDITVWYFNTSGKVVGRSDSAAIAGMTTWHLVETPKEEYEFMHFYYDGSVDDVWYDQANPFDDSDQIVARLKGDNSSARFVTHTEAYSLSNK
jgi:hypothetical protein